MFGINREIKFWSMAKRFLQHVRYDSSTDIDGADLIRERLYVRGKDINDLIGSVTFTEAIFHILLNRMPAENERKIFDAVLVSFHGGFGYSPPTVLLARLSATTGTSVPHALSAGYAGGGKYHVGAIENAMEMFEQIKAAAGGGTDIGGHAKRYIEDVLSKKQILYGYGHPLFKKDPRPERLRLILGGLGYTSEYIDIYDEVTKAAWEKKGLYPNIDGINAAILLSLGFKKDYGAGLFLLARTSAMLAHVVEERTKEPFYLEDKLYPMIRSLEKERGGVR